MPNLAPPAARPACGSCGRTHVDTPHRRPQAAAPSLEEIIAALRPGQEAGQR